MFCIFSNNESVPSAHHQSCIRISTLNQILMGAPFAPCNMQAKKKAGNLVIAGPACF
jgi:hypothetical protein